MDQKEIIDIFDYYNAIWIHNGDPAMPHAELTTGLCSNGYVNCREVLQHSLVCKMLARKLYYKMFNQNALSRFNMAVGSSYSAITFSYEFAARFGVKHGFTEKDPLDPKGKKMIWNGGEIRPEEKVLQIEDLITTGRTLFEVRRAMQKESAQPINFLNVVGCIVHRPSDLAVNYDGLKIVSLIEREIWAVKPENCFLCKAGSKRLRPRGNWKELTTGKSN